MRSPLGKPGGLLLCYAPGPGTPLYACVSMPSRFEYAFVILMLGMLLAAVFHRPLGREARRPAFWVGLAVFFAGCMVLELVALTAGWWTFEPSKVLGLWLLGIPVEELLLFVGFFVLVTGLSEMTPDDLG